MPHTGLAVVEARWWSEGNDSIRPLFETVSGIVEGNPHSVRYDMFCDEGSLSRIFGSISKDVGIHSVYIGAHGDESSIAGLGDVSISRTKLRNMIAAKNKSGNLSGLYFGSCLVGTETNAQFLLNSSAAAADRTNLRWVAGYKTSVDWVDSSAIDMIFWSKLLHERKRNRSRRKGKKTPLEMAKDASKEMKRLMPTVFNELGFNVYHRDTGGQLTSVW